jgi:hypothetical protein
MNYNEFEKKVADTFNRMHIVESCDDGFIEYGAEYDVGMLLMKSMIGMFHIEYERHKGYTVSREELTQMFEADLDYFLLEALDSFNLILDKFNVVFNDNPAYERCKLHII